MRYQNILPGLSFTALGMIAGMVAPFHCCLALCDDFFRRQFSPAFRFQHVNEMLGFGHEIGLVCSDN
jgi:hypothetical protein